MERSRPPTSTQQIRRRRARRSQDDGQPTAPGPRALGPWPGHGTARAARHDAVAGAQQQLGNQVVQRRLVQREHTTLSQGSSGPEVRALQELLNAAGASLEPDGIFGAATRAAVIALQQQRGLTPDGIVGPNTWAALKGGPGAGVDPMVGAESPEQEAVRAFARAAALFDAEQYAEALRFYQMVYRLPELGTHRAGATWNMARCQQMLGNRTEAIALFQEYMLFPGAATDEALEMIRRLRAGEDAPNDLSTLEQPTAEERAEADAQARQELDAGHAAGDPSAALPHYEAAYNLRASPDLRHEATIALANTHRDLNHAEQAIDLWQEALSFPGVTDEERLMLTDQIRRMRVGGAADLADAQPLTPQEQELEHTLGSTAFEGGRYEEALEHFGRLYAQPELRGTLIDRPTLIYMMALANQRLEQYDMAISLFQEEILYPGTSEGARQEALEHIRQCRMGEQESHVRLDGETISNDETRLIEGQVFFETGKAEISGLGNDTIRGVVDLLRERHAAQPGLSFRIAVVGGASSRWRGAEGPDESDRLNLALSWQRAAAVETAIVAQLPPEEIASGVYAMHTDAQGDAMAEALGLDPDDNTWRLRSVMISVWAREAAVP